ncbi:hypothetical protein GCM10010399_07370 [Dactylosporangium fulvum]|uniref:Uncharacterized protein n=1 Tax=Dactylosporangium fulvum TaxID=53359 RepID=A0ABY5WB50_9ACTN|nr:hypothetical protein [Dactylosporangium fulvum]UWP86615.1 hypothetical protein Dfulv_21190 [Dactylosporangium fulvum]
MELSRRKLLITTLAVGGAAALNIGLDPRRAHAKPQTVSTPLAPLAWDIHLRPIAARRSGSTSAVYDAANNVCTFTYTEGGHTVVYTVNLASPQVQNGLIEVGVRVDNRGPITAVAGAGTYYLPLSGSELAPEGLANAATTSMTTAFANQVLTLTYVDSLASVDTTKTFSFQLLKKSLMIRATSDSSRGRGGYTGFGTGRAVTSSSLSQHTSVFVEEVAVTLVDQAYFVSAYLDKAKTGSTLLDNSPGVTSGAATHGMVAHYELNSAGETNPLDETMYVTASADLLDCVYLTNATKSAYRDTLDSLVIYDTWEYRPSYQERKRHYRMLHERFGMDDLLLIDHRWQRDTLDISNPAHYPASTTWGSAKSFANYLATAHNLSWTVALHEDYWFMYPSATNQYWNVPNVEEKLAQDANGNLRHGWLTTSYANKSDQMLEYAEIESNLIKNNYHTSSAFLDVNGGVDPSVMNQVTLNADSSTSRSLAQVVADNVALFEGMKGIYQGPVMSEGAQGARAFGSAYAGHIDATEREITGLQSGRIMPDYELRHIRPLQANQGMGYPWRFDPDAARIRYELSAANTGTGVPNLAKLSTGAVGDHGVYYFAAAGSGQGTTLTLMSRGSDTAMGGEYWYHDDGAGRRSLVAPLLYPGIGVADPGSTTYPVIGFKAPESGWMVARFSATAYPQPGSGGFTLTVCHNGFGPECEVSKEAGDEYWAKVLKGDMLYLVFRTNGTTVPGDRCGYYAWVAYADVEEPAVLSPVTHTNYELCGSDPTNHSTNLAQLGSGLQDDYGLQYFAATGSGASTHLTKLRLAHDADLGGEHWADTDGQTAVSIAPLMHSGVGVAFATNERYPVAAFRAPAPGTLFLGFNFTEYVGASSAGFTVEVFQNGFDSSNKMNPNQPGQYWICVEKDDLLYFSFRPDGNLAAGDHVSYYAYIAYAEQTTSSRRWQPHSHATPPGTVVNCQTALPQPLPSGAALQVRAGFYFDFDRYNSMAIAYGHTGFIGELHHGMVEQQVNAYYMFRAIQSQYLDTAVTVVAITYFGANGTSFDVNTAIKNGYNFTKARLSIEYSNDLKIYLNFSDNNWTVNVNGTNYVLNRNGYVAVNPSEAFRQFSCLVNGERADYVDCTSYTYANPRGRTVDFGGGLVVSEMTIQHK